MIRRTDQDFSVWPRHPMAVWLILGAVFLGSAGVNLFLGVLDAQAWPFVVGFALVAVAVWCAVMAWRERA